MKVNVTKKEEIEIDINEIEAFRILCKTLHMDFIFNEELNLYVAWDEVKKEYFVMKDKEIYDDRGELYLILCKLISLIVPNCELRNSKIKNMKKIKENL